MSEWRAVPGWEGLYEVSDDGRVRSLDRVVEHPTAGPRRLRGRELKANWDGRDKGGYLYVTLSRPGERRNKHLHTLVLETFVEPRPVGAEACHGPEGKTVNTPANLRWDTKSGNMTDAVAAGTHNMSRKVVCKRGHRLEGANLVATALATGKRKCRACEIAYSRVRNQVEREIRERMQVEADAAYAELMGAA